MHGLFRGEAGEHVGGGGGGLSAPLSEVTILTKELNACTDNIATWMTENQLKLNDDKTEALLFPFSSSLKTFYRSPP